MEQVHELAPTDGKPPVRVRSVRRDLDRIARALQAAADGDFSARVRLPPSSPLWRIAAAADGLIARNAQISREFNRVCRRIAVDGQLSERAHVSNLGGQYASSLSAFNELLDQLTWHAAETGAVARALEQGELGRTMPLQAPDGAPVRAPDGLSRAGQRRLRSRSERNGRRPWHSYSTVTVLARFRG